MKVLTRVTHVLISLALLALPAMASGIATAAVITPTVDGTVRDGLDSPKDGTPDAVLENSIVQALDVPQFEDRGIIEFDISSLSPSIQRVELTLTIFGSNGPFPFTIDVFTYAGNGILSLSDFNAGALFTSFEYSGQTTVTLDVTKFIKGLTTSGSMFAGFNFQFAVPSSITLNGPFVAFNSLEFLPAAQLVTIEELVVNGYKLKGNEETWVRFVGETIVSQLLGSRNDQILTAARACWWGLKEGTFSLANPHVFSSCSVLQKDGSSKDVRLKPLEVCDPGRAWQVGLAAVQVPNFTEQEVLDAIQALWPGRAVIDVLAEAAEIAGFDPNQGTGAAVVASNGVLRKSWLLRHPTVGLTLVERNVTSECINTSIPRGTCYGTGWQETKRYAPTPEAIPQSIADLTTIFNILAP
jgi:hypothetical protein